MVAANAEIILCPLDRRAEALALALSELSPSQRREVAGAFWPRRDVPPAQLDGLYVALRGENLCAAAWAQRQPGNTAVFWPPQLVLDEEASIAQRLAEIAVADLDHSGVAMAQVLLPSQDSEAVPMLKSVGFRHLADLIYLTCEAERFSASPTSLPAKREREAPAEPNSLDAIGSAGASPSQSPVLWDRAKSRRELEFVPYDESMRPRLRTLIEQTYQGTLDCVALNGTRQMADVIAGYQSTGVFRPENWLIVRGGGQDAGVLLLADHPAVRHWELVYMGLVPTARGRGWGRQITQHAQAMARAANVERIVLAVDAGNEPALRMYRAVGFESWDRRTVFVRFPANSQT